jgi:hypothetical protein
METFKQTLSALVHTLAISIGLWASAHAVHAVPGESVETTIGFIKELLAVRRTAFFMRVASIRAEARQMPASYIS